MHEEGNQLSGRVKSAAVKPLDKRDVKSASEILDEIELPVSISHVSPSKILDESITGSEPFHRQSRVTTQMADHEARQRRFDRLAKDFDTPFLDRQWFSA